MKAAVLVKTGAATTAFQLREVPTPVPAPHEVLIAVEGFGLNFADVMARKGQYQDAPPLPSVIGYDVVGNVTAIGSHVSKIKIGDRVTALTKFGGYAQFAVSDERAVAIISDTMPVGEATALTTQYCTAYYLAAEATNLHKGDTVLIHSAAGGVGTALLQYCLYQGCETIATVGSASKAAFVKKAGAHHVINYTEIDFAKEVMQLTKGKGVDVIFDAVGGNYVKRGFKILSSGGRILCYGAADLSNRNVFSKLKAALDFGIYHPAEFMMNSKSMLGVNMLRIAENKPETLQRCLEKVVQLYHEKVFQPQVGNLFPIEQLAAAHEFLESRKSTGKITVLWW